MEAVQLIWDECDWAQVPKSAGGGLFMVCADTETHGARALLYIQAAASFADTFARHRTWLLDEKNPAVYVAPTKVDTRTRGAAARLLIWTYCPAYNAPLHHCIRWPGLAVVNLGSRGRLSEHCHSEATAHRPAL